jgi:tryptophan halogenase
MEIKKINFHSGSLKNPWKGNCVAVGLSSGFVEPLESNGLSQVILQLELLERYWNPRSDSSTEKVLYNRYFTHLVI